MSQDAASGLAIHLEDGRTLIAIPGPEDQDRLAQFGGGSVSLSAGTADLDTEAHAYSSDLTVDVEGHALTLHLPTAADADALRKALAVGIVSATIVAAGAIAAMQGSPAVPSTQSTVSRPAAPAPAEDFQTRREREIDRMLEAPAGEIAPANAPVNRRVGGPQD